MAGISPPRYRKEISCVTLNLLKDGGKMKSQLVAAADRAAMSVAYGQEAADHYGIQYGFIRSVRDWITGFTEGIKGERC